MNSKPVAGSKFPPILVKTLEDTETLLVDVVYDPSEQSSKKGNWTMVVFYRGQHCPICRNFLNALDSLAGGFQGINVDIVAVSGDSKQQLEKNIEDDLDVSFPIYHSLQLAEMKNLGLYISEPVSDSETDHLFNEPALFVLNERNEIQLVDIASGPFSRPNLDQLLQGLTYARENDYPIRGTY
ncbi:redoxin domain-containing protein [Aliiglaciecola sp. LCG003]|uniref:redoxin domain-containing protein n=1 Tax=Aliiglaciecola sp. LCG003 TaxID=3053655 RepID=UPI002572F00C|nr:redoxin domain-containing protein [Aliiglaciecola sp. LCG003]WJG09671.1 redoxin domain-containing protein [Aliiglaciecola sp. LCG003]